MYLGSHRGTKQQCSGVGGVGWGCSASAHVRVVDGRVAAGSGHSDFGLVACFLIPIIVEVIERGGEWAPGKGGGGVRSAPRGLFPLRDEEARWERMGGRGCYHLSGLSIHRGPAFPRKTSSPITKVEVVEANTPITLMNPSTTPT